MVGLLRPADHAGPWSPFTDLLDAAILPAAVARGAVAQLDAHIPPLRCRGTLHLRRVEARSRLWGHVQWGSPARAAWIASVVRLASAW